MRILKAKVHGKVQGVWFRKYTLDCANRLRIVGIVKNLNDGTVLVYAKGKNLEEFKKYLKSGPPDSDVNKIEYSWYTSKIEFSDFKIEYR
tara:strand:+ start:172 stop:441 length:270 start_codon:yes stop_codon:yes gene_type:complete